MALIRYGANGKKGSRDLSQAAYTEEDMKKLLRHLFFERKRVKELQQRVEDLGNERQALQRQLEDLGPQTATAVATLQETSEVSSLEGEALLSRPSEEAEGEFSAEQPLRQGALEQEHLADEREEFQRERQRWQESLAKAEEELQNAKVALDDAHRQNQSLHDSFQALEQQQQANKEAEAELQGRVLKAEQAAAEARRLQDEADQKLSSYETSSKHYDLSNQQLKENLQLAEEKQAALSRELQVAKEDLARIYQQLDVAHGNGNVEVRQIIEEKASLIKEREGYRLEAQAAQAQLDEARKQGAAFESQRKQWEKQMADKDGHTLLLQQNVQRLESDLQKQCDQFEEAQGRWLSAQEGLALLQDKFVQMEQQAAKWRQERESVENVRSAERIQFQEHLTTLQKELEQKTQFVNSLQKEFDLAKQALVLGIREAKDIESRYLETVAEKVAAIGRCRQLEEGYHSKESERLRVAQELQERDNALSTQQARNDYLQQSLDAVKAHNLSLQERVAILETSCQQTSNAKAELQQRFSSVAEELQSVSRSSEALRQQIGGMQQEAEEWKKRHETLQIQSQEDKKKIEALQEELARARVEMTRAESLRQEKQMLEENYHQLKGELDEAVARCEEALEGHHRLQGKSEELAVLVQQNERLLAEKSQQMASLHSSLENREATLQQAQQLLADKENSIRELQVHLKNKVKDFTLLSEHFEEQKSQLAEAQNNAVNWQAKINDLKTSLEAQQQQEKRLQELLNESIKAAESQVGKWEEKYLRMHDKWQDAESRIKDFRRQEEKYRQIEKLLSSLGHFMGQPMGSPAAAMMKEAEGIQRSLPAAEENLQASFPTVEDKEESVSRLEGFFSLNEEGSQHRDTLF